MRKHTPIRHLILGGISFLAMTAGASLAENAPPAAAQKPEAKPSEARALPPTIEPGSAAKTVALDETGLIDAQEKIGSDILLLDRQLRRAQMIGDVIKMMGPEAFKKEFPELAGLIKDSPLVLQANLEEQKILGQIEIEKQKIVEAKATSEAEKAGGKSAAPMPAVRNDGSAMFVPPSEASLAQRAINGTSPAPTMQVPPQATATKSASPAQSLARDPAPKTEKAKPSEDIAISLREIYGTKGSYSAVITHGGEKIRVERGDTLPGDTRIDFIGEDYIKVTRHGKSIRYEIRG